MSTYEQMAQKYVNGKYTRPANWADPCSGCIKPCDPTCNPCIPQPPIEPCALPYNTTITSLDPFGNCCSQTMTALASPYGNPLGLPGSPYVDPVIAIGPRPCDPLMTPGVYGPPPGQVTLPGILPGMAFAPPPTACGGAVTTTVAGPAACPPPAFTSPIGNIAAVLQGVSCGPSCVFGGDSGCSDKGSCKKSCSKKSCGKKSCNCNKKSSGCGSCKKKSCGEKKICGATCEVAIAPPPVCEWGWGFPNIGAPCGPGIGGGCGPGIGAPCGPNVIYPAAPLGFGGGPTYPAPAPPPCEPLDPCLNPWARHWPWVRNSWYANNSPFNSMV